MFRNLFLATLTTLSLSTWSAVAFAGKDVTPYPVPRSVAGTEDWFPINDRIEVEVDGLPVPVWRTDGKNIAHFGFNEGESVDVVVKYLDDPEEVDGSRVMPTAYGIRAKTNASEGTISFKLQDTTQSKVVVRRASGKVDELLVLGGKNVEEPSSPTFRVERGKELPDTLKERIVHAGRFILLKSDETLYIEAGAVLGYGIRIEDGAKDVKIFGPGVVRLSNGFGRNYWFFDPSVPFDVDIIRYDEKNDPGREKHRQGKYHRVASSISTIEGFNVEEVHLEGVLVANGIDDDVDTHKAAFQTLFRGSRDITIKNISEVAAQRQSDGLTLKGCKEVRVSDSFIGTGDNAILFGAQGLTRDLNYKNIVVYQLGSTNVPKENSGSKGTVIIEGNLKKKFRLDQYLHGLEQFMSTQDPSYLEDYAESVVEDVTIDGLYVIDQFDHDDRPSERHLVTFLGSTPSSAPNIRQVKGFKDVVLKNVYMEPHLDKQMLFWGYDHGPGEEEQLTLGMPSDITFENVWLYRPSTSSTQPGAIRMTSENLTVNVKHLHYNDVRVTHSTDTDELRENARIIDQKINEAGAPRFNVLRSDDRCDYPEWRPTRRYEAGEIVSFGSWTYEARAAHSDLRPDLHNGPEGSAAAWKEAKECPECVPLCRTRSCGDDGCGGSCGECEEGSVCSDIGACVTADSCTAPAWDEGAAYWGGELVSRAGHEYRAWYWTQGDDPGEMSGPQSSGLPWGPGMACGDLGGASN